MTENRVVTASRDIAAPAAAIFELIADPARQPEWDGNDNLAVSAPGQRVTAVGDVFVTTLTNGQDRANRIVEFEEGRAISWRPSPVDGAEPGHQWGWRLEPVDDGTTRVTHRYDWTDLTDESRFERARATTADRLQASLTNLARVAEGSPES